MTRLDDEQIWRDDLAERRRERDREREPARIRAARLPAPDHRARHSFQARQVELAHAAVDSSITAMECPACLAPVFAPADSHAERIDCVGCDARLVTHRAIGGELTAILLPDGAP